MKIDEKIFLLGCHRYHSSINKVITDEKFKRFDSIFQDLANFIYSKIEDVNSESDRAFRIDDYLDIIRINIRYLEEQYNLLLFEFDGLGQKKEYIENKLETAHKSVYKYSAIQRGVFEKGNQIDDITTMFFFAFFVIVQGTFRQKMNIFMEESDSHTIIHYFKPRNFFNPDLYSN